jgi:hypothetical protein
VGPFMSLMRVADSSLGGYAAVTVGRSLTALTALQTLNMSGKAPCVCCVVVWSVFQCARGGCDKGRLRVGPFVSPMRVAGNRLEDCFGEIGVAMGQSLTALTALQTLDLSGNDLYCLCCFLNMF